MCRLPWLSGRDLWVEESHKWYVWESSNGLRHIGEWPVGSGSHILFGILPEEWDILLSGMMPSRLDGETSRRASNWKWGNSESASNLSGGPGDSTWDNGVCSVAEAGERKEIVEVRLLFVRTFDGPLGRMTCKKMQINKNEILWKIP
jgi:hypothetical protein